MHWTDSSQRTGAVTCRASSSLTRAASWFGFASTLVTTGTAGAFTSTRASSDASRSAAGCISAQWNGALTASGIARFAPRVLAAAHARSTAALCPAITTWPPPLRFAGLTTSAPAASLHTAATSSRRQPDDRGHRAHARPAPPPA